MEQELSLRVLHVAKPYSEGEGADTQAQAGRLWDLRAVEEVANSRCHAYRCVDCRCLRVIDLMMVMDCWWEIESSLMLYCERGERGADCDTKES